MVSHVLAPLLISGWSISCCFLSNLTNPFQCRSNGPHVPDYRTYDQRRGNRGEKGFYIKNIRLSCQPGDPKDYRSGHVVHFADDCRLAHALGARRGDSLLGRGRCFLAWDNTDLIPARQLVPFKTRFRLLLNAIPFHLGFGLPFLIPGLNLLLLSFAPIGATLYHMDKNKDQISIKNSVMRPNGVS